MSFIINLKLFRVIGACLTQVLVASNINAGEIYQPKNLHIDDQFFHVIGIKPGMTWHEAEDIVRRFGYVYPSKNSLGEKQPIEPQSNSTNGTIKLKQFDKITSKQRFEQPLLAMAKENNWISLNYCQNEEKLYIVGVNRMSVVTEENYRELEHDYKLVQSNDEYTVYETKGSGKIIQKNTNPDYKLRAQLLLIPNIDEYPVASFLFATGVTYHSEKMVNTQCQFSLEYLGIL